jgi:UV DNA damage endonuclease
MPHAVGYCCINLTLQKSRNLTTNRGMIQRTFMERGVNYASELALQNARDLVEIIKWNAENEIKVFRMSSDLFPWNSKYKLTDLPDYDKISQYLLAAGAIAYNTGQRITAHPDHFVKLGSAKPEVVDNAIHDLEHHSEVFDIMGLEASHYNCLNIHVGMNYADDTIDRWLHAFDRLSDNCKQRLVVENDDKASAFSINQLYNRIYKQIKTPLTFDYFHHTFHADNLSSQDAASLAASTWKAKPLFHYSESKNINENVTGNPRAHADYVFSFIDDYGLDIDIDLEAKAKELALFKYRSLT